MVFLAENSCGFGTQGIRGSEDCLEMDWTETEVCIKCDKGGKLLVCTDSNCPLAVHEECMHCSTRFDSTGNFYCPYCSYKRAMLETRKARKKAMLAKKALSIFLDTGIVDGAPQKPKKAERDRRKVLKQSTAVGDPKPDDNRNSLDGNEVDHHFMPIEKDQCEKTFDLCKRAKESEVNEQNAGLDVGAQHKVVIEEHMRPGPIIPCGDQNERLLQDEQQPGPLRPILADREIEVACAILLAITDGLDNADVVKDHEGSRAEAEAEAEVMQDQEKGNPLSGSGSDFIQKEAAEDSDTSHRDNGYASPHWRHIKKNQNDIQSPSVDSTKRSTRKSPKLNANVVHKEKKDAMPKSRLTSPAFPHARRKKLPWTSDEEEMLKEGVQKFSTTVNKNLPWRKILEFGHHVFHCTRTPADLKDKWRNILIKEGSTK